jgi:hypothetical protein
VQSVCSCSLYADIPITFMSTDRRFVGPRSMRRSLASLSPSPALHPLFLAPEEYASPLRAHPSQKPQLSLTSPSHSKQPGQDCQLNNNPGCRGILGTLS